MNKVIGILLIGLLGFSGCSGSDAGTSPAYNVQAIGLVNGSGLSVSAYVMDQEEQFSSDAIITINGEPMNIGFVAAEDMNIDGEDSLTDHNNPIDHGVPSGDYLPFYFLESVDLNAGDTVRLSVKGKYGTIYSSSAVVPEKVTLIEPSSDATFLPGQEVYLKWEGGDSSTCFQVQYSGGNEDASYSSDWLKDQRDYIIPAGVIEAGALSLMVSGRDCSLIQHEEDERTSSSLVFEVFEIGVGWVDFVSEQIREASGICMNCKCRKLCLDNWDSCMAQVSRYPPGQWIHAMAGRHKCFVLKTNCESPCRTKYCKSHCW